MFMSRKFNEAEQNYEIYDKEMLAIVETMDKYRHYFEGLAQKTTVYSDHRNLLWFTETKVYNRRQARWAEKLSRFDFVIVFRPGKQGGKPDALSRRPDHFDGPSVPRQAMTFLKPNQVDTALLPSDVPSLSLNLAIINEVSVDKDLQHQIHQALPQDSDVGPYLTQIKDPNLPRDEATQEYLRPFSFHDSTQLLLRHGLVYIPQNDQIKLAILRNHHDSKTAGHLGEAKTLELITRDYYWPRMRQFVNEYIKSCDTCCRNKAPRTRPHGRLHPLPIPSAPWSSVSMDYIVELPPSHGYDAIYVAVDRLTKMAHFCPTSTHVTAEDTADLYLHHIFKNHGLPQDIVSDRGSQFVSKFTRRLLDLCDVKGNRSTAYHPQSDGQTERVNQVLEQYLRTFCDYQQDDWCQLLPLAEFAYNNASHASTKMSPFYANYGYHPRATVKPIVDSVNPTAETFISRITSAHSELVKNLTEAQATYKANYDTHVKEAPDFSVGDLVWLSRKNITTTRPSTKLDFRRLGPFKITEVVGESKAAFKLDLPPTMQIHPVFPVSLLTPHHANSITGREQPLPPPVVVENELEWEVKEILDSKLKRGKLHYYVDWKGYTPQDRTWEPAANVQNSPQVIAEFHTRYPLRPSPKDVHVRGRE